jgi:hypothetical protein
MVDITGYDDDKLMYCNSCKGYYVKHRMHDEYECRDCYLSSIDGAYMTE